MLAYRTTPAAIAALLVASLVASLASAYPLNDSLEAENAEFAERSRDGRAGDDFGPTLRIEAIHIVGNRSTDQRLIHRVLPVRPGDIVRAGDARLVSARFKVLALGFFRDVVLHLRKGTTRGAVILIVEVIERGTVTLDRLYFGSSTSTPWWAGAEVTDQNFVGTGLIVGGGFVVADSGDITGSKDQWAVTAHVGDRSILGSMLGAHLRVIHAEGSYPYRISGADDDGSLSNFDAFHYSRTGAVGGVGIAITPLSQLSVSGRVERIRARLPEMPQRETINGLVEPVDLGFGRGVSYVSSLSLGFDRDTRPDPILPYSGYRFSVATEFAAKFLGGDYNYASALMRYEHWWPIRTLHHVVSLRLWGGLIVGDAPSTDRLHAADLNRLLTPRALGLVMATSPSPTILNGDSDQHVVGELGGSAMVEYSYRLFRNRRHIYGGDLFLGVGVWGLTTRDQVSEVVPIDLVIDAGMRLDTEIGIFELTFANALGRLPF